MADIGVTVNSQSNLFQIIPALRSPSGLTSLLHRWEQEGNQDCNDRDHHQ